MPRLVIEAVTGVAGFLALAPAWSNLLERAAQASPFQAPEWLVPWWRRFGTGRPHVLAGWDGARLAGLAPLYDDGTRLAFMGAGISDEHGLLVEDEHGPAFARGALEHLEAFPRVDLDQLPPWDPLVPLLGVRGQPGDPLMAGALPGWRDRVERGVRRDVSGRALRRLGLAPVRFERADAHTVEEFLDALFALHREGGLLGEGMRAFHGEVAHGLLARDWLRLHGLRAGGRLVAVLYGILFRRRLCVYLTGFADEVAAASPGTVLLARALDDAEAEGAAEFDLLRGREPYKYRWGASERWNRRAALRNPSAASRGAF